MKRNVSVFLAILVFVTLAGAYVLHTTNRRVVLLSPLATSSVVLLLPNTPSTAAQTPTADQPEPLPYFEAVPESHTHGVCSDDCPKPPAYESPSVPQALFLTGWAKDSGSIYYGGKKINADASSFKLIRGALRENMDEYIELTYAVDKNAVYYDGTRLLNADPSRFKPLNQTNERYAYEYGISGDTIYFHADPIVGADVRTFEVLWQTPKEGCTDGYPYSKDALHIYYQNTIVAGADPATFEGLDNGYGKDRRGYYLNGSFVGPAVDQKLFECQYG